MKFAPKYRRVKLDPLLTFVKILNAQNLVPQTITGYDIIQDMVSNIFQKVHIIL